MRSLPVNVLGNGSEEASGRQACACAGEERTGLFSDSENRFFHVKLCFSHCCS